MNRYQYALFIEKEGFGPLFERSQLAERYDLAIFSSKGQSNTATRQLIDQLSQAGVTILALHDFDRAGLLIERYLSDDSRRYGFTVKPRVIDLGLRLADVEPMKLQSEPVEYRQRSSRTVLLDCHDVAREEIRFLVDPRPESAEGGWVGQRVKLNAMTSKQMIGWLEAKFKEHGVEKVVPTKATLKIAWKRAQMVAKINTAVDQVIEDMSEDGSTRRAPKDIEKRCTSCSVVIPRSLGMAP